MEEERYVENKLDSEEINVFREIEKYYKLQPRVKAKDSTDFSNVIDFSNLENNSEENKKLIIPVDMNKLRAELGDIIEPNLHFEKVYALSNLEGFYFIPNPFTNEEQYYWVRKCLHDFPIGNPTNISNLNKTQPWTEWKYEELKSLRWCTLGYHFQWTQRLYSDEFRGEFPSDLLNMTKSIAEQLKFKFEPQAATINFYPIAKQMMGGHLDDAEEDLTKPIVSCSFGNTVVFLIGGKTRSVKPTALYIRSGDIVIMGGESRYSYHGVPRMIEYSSPLFLSDYKDIPEKDNHDKYIKEYIKNSRINMNVRQVRIIAPKVS